MRCKGGRGLLSKQRSFGEKPLPCPAVLFVSSWCDPWSGHCAHKVTGGRVESSFTTPMGGKENLDLGDVVNHLPAALLLREDSFMVKSFLS